MFMHDLSSPMHIAFNMYALWMFGSPIENALGQKRFIFFYFSAGLGAALIHTLVNYYHFNNASEAIMALGFNAQDITQGPIARVKIPHRVPTGFHAWWSRGEDLWK